MRSLFLSLVFLSGMAQADGFEPNASIAIVECQINDHTGSFPADGVIITEGTSEILDFKSTHFTGNAQFQGKANRLIITAVKDQKEAISIDASGLKVGSKISAKSTSKTSSLQLNCEVKGLTE